MSHDDPADEDPPPEDAFALVGNEIRAEIVRALGAARTEARTNPVLAFSELRSRVASDVRSSQFNYHLQQLVGRFLEKTAEGYRLRPEGWLLYRTLAAGTFDRRSTLSSVDAGVDCYHCSTRVEAAVEDGLVRVACPGCDYRYDVATVPPGGVEDGTVDLGAVARYNHHRHLAFARGVCPTCGSGLDTELVAPEDSPWGSDDRTAVHVHRTCDRCGDELYLSVGEALLDDPDLIAFCREHGTDLLSTPLWELEFAATDRGVEVRSTEPWEVALTVSYGDAALELVVDGDGSVVDRTRS